MTEGEITAVLLPDGLWHEIEPGSYRIWSGSPAAAGVPGQFEFREAGQIIRGHSSSVLATREPAPR